VSSSKLIQLSSNPPSLDSKLQESNQLDWAILEIFISPSANALHAEGMDKRKVLEISASIQNRKNVKESVTVRARNNPRSHS
jgi:hypothetical protein